MSSIVGGTGNVLKIGALIAVGIIGLIVATSAIKGVKNFDIGKALGFGGGEENKTAQDNGANSQGGNTSDAEAQLARAETERIKAEATYKRALDEADRAEAEGRRADAENLRANAEILRAEAEKSRAYNDRLAIEAGFNPFSTDQVQEPTTKKQQVTIDTQTIQDITKTGNTKSPDLLAGYVELVRTTGKNKGATIKIRPDEVNTWLARGGFALPQDANIVKTDISATKPQYVGVSYEQTPEQKAVATINAKKSGNKSTFFSDGSRTQITVVSNEPSVKILGGGGTDKGTQFSIQEKAPTTLSDVLKSHPEFTSSQARDYLSRLGTFDTEYAKQQFLSKDFGTNTGSGQKIPTVNKGGSTTSQSGERPRASQTARELEAKRAQEKVQSLLNHTDIPSSQSLKSAKGGVENI